MTMTDPTEGARRSLRETIELTEEAGGILLRANEQADELAEALRGWPAAAHVVDPMAEAEHKLQRARDELDDAYKELLFAKRLFERLAKPGL